MTRISGRFEVFLVRWREAAILVGDVCLRFLTLFFIPCPREGSVKWDEIYPPSFSGSARFADIEMVVGN